MLDEFKTFKEIEAIALPEEKMQSRRMHARKMLKVNLKKKLGPVFRNK